MSRFSKKQSAYSFALIALLVACAIDIWMLSLRCSASPNIDYSRFGFVIVLQLLAALGLVLVGHIFPAPDANFKLSNFVAVVFAVVLGTIPMARDAVLFGTAIDPHRDQKPLDYGCNNPE